MYTFSFCNMNSIFQNNQSNLFWKIAIEPNSTKPVTQTETQIDMYRPEIVL